MTELDLLDVEVERQKFWHSKQTTVGPDLLIQRLIAELRKLKAVVTDPELLAIEARALAAKNVDGGWSDRSSSGYIPQGSSLGQSLIQLGDTYEGNREDCDFLASARKDVLALVQEVRKLSKK